MLNKYTTEDLAPHKLSKEQKENPLLLFYQLFDYASLPQLREHLWLWLKLTVTNGYTKSYFGYRERDNIIILYEYMEKLLEASYLLYAAKKEELRHLYNLTINEELGGEENALEKEKNDR